MDAVRWLKTNEDTPRIRLIETCWQNVRHVACLTRIEARHREGQCLFGMRGARLQHASALGLTCERYVEIGMISLFLFLFIFYIYIMTVQGVLFFTSLTFTGVNQLQITQ